MTDTAAMCPYCKAQYVPGTLRCAACAHTFPWAIEDELLRGEMKARETNRFRATTTLASEALTAVKGGPSISLEAIKGFITAWLFPRTVIVIGSLVGALLLGLQTYIIWGQTKLLRLQAEAAQVDQAARIRERIAREVAVVDQLLAIERGLGRGPLIQCGDDCKSTKFLDKIRDASKRRAPPEVVILDIKTRPSVSATSPSAHSTQVFVQPQRVDATDALGLILRTLRRSIRALGPLKIKDTSEPAATAIPLAALSDVIEPAFIECLPELAIAGNLDQATRLIGELSTGIELYVKGTGPTLEFAIAIAQLSASPDLSKPADLVDMSTIETYTVAQFSKDFTVLHETLRGAVEALRSRCGGNLRRNVETLRAIDAAERR